MADDTFLSVLLPEVVTEVPGPESKRLAADLRRHESRNVTYVSDHWPVFWERAEGVNVWDVDGNRFLDLTSAFAVAGLGHARPELVQVMSRQASRLLHGMGDVHPSGVKVELCARLSELTFERWGAGPGKVILSTSGAEAVESSLKTALLATGREGILAFEGGYHGLGYGALLPTGIEKFRAPFSSQLVPVSTWLPFPRRDADLEVLRERLKGMAGGRIGAVLVEPIQGRGGVVIPPPGFLGMLREWCDQVGALLVFDEIYTGFNRTGSLFCCEEEGIVPDLICLGKALSGGFPISACVGRAEVMDAWPESTGEALHTSTFLGHPVGCAMALEALRIHQATETRDQVASLADRLGRTLAQLDAPIIREVRGRGAMWGVELAIEAGGREAGRVFAGAVTQFLLERGILILPGGLAGNVLSLSPPFAMRGEEVAHAGAELAEALRVVGLPGATGEAGAGAYE